VSRRNYQTKSGLPERVGKPPTREQIEQDFRNAERMARGVPSKLTITRVKKGGAK